MAKVISQKRFINEALEAHNKYRKLHDSPALELDPKLTELALEWAENLAEENKLKYSNSSLNSEPVGENLLRTKAKYLSGEQCTEEWYKQNSVYDYDGKFNVNTGYFTQLVWKSTRKVGFGFATNEEGFFYVVANYYPAGNFKNEFNLNVLKPKSADQVLKNRLNEPISKIQNSPVMQRNIAQNSPQLPRNIPMYNPKDFDPNQDRFIQEALQTHNKLRRKHGAEPLIHNPDLSKIAQNYASYLARIGTMVHSSNNYNNQKLGENLAYSYDSRSDYYSGEKATNQWYSEIEFYRYNDYQKGTGHFTQVVWKGSKEVGFGLAKARDGSFYAVANYFPAGNFIGQFSKNVSRPVE